MGNYTKHLEDFEKVQTLTHTFAKQELSAGYKQSHWMWWTFPQIVGLGHSELAYRYGIESLDEAKEYLQNDFLRNNLYELCQILLDDNKTACEIFGSVDAMKLKSCMTLFDLVEPNGIFEQVLVKFYGGDRCRLTLRRTVSVAKDE